LGRAWPRRMVAQNITVPGGLKPDAPGALAVWRADSRRDVLRCSRREKNDCDRTRRRDLERSTDEVIGPAAQRLPATNQREGVQKRSSGLRRGAYVLDWDRRGRKIRETPLDSLDSFRDGSRSFSVNVRLGRYRCFRCGSHGNALELWAAVHHLSVYAAAVDLCQQLGLEIPWVRRW